MARIRTIKPEFWGHPVMARLPEHVQLMALALLNYADDEGYFLADPALVRSFARPFDEDSSKTTGALRELSNIGYLETFESASHGKIGRVIKFDDHQAISHPRSSKIKGYASMNLPVTLHEDSGLEQGTGNREQGKESTGVTDESFTLDAAVSLVLIEAGLAGKELRTVIHQVIARDIKILRVEPKNCAEAMVAAWQKYDAMDLSFKYGPVNFFGTGIWRKTEKEWRGSQAQSGPQNIDDKYIPESLKRKRDLEARKAAGL